MTMSVAVIAVAGVFLVGAAGAAPDAGADAGGKTYRNERGKEVHFPLGELSFADEVVAFEKGKPSGPEEHSDPAATLGPPDYVRGSTRKDLTLGCAGRLTLRFADNSLVDVAGPDLYVFEVGPQVEATVLEISTDGSEWLDVGKIAGGTAEVDIGARSKPGEVYYFVRLTDLKKGCGGGYPGADLDAVGAIGSALRLSLSDAVLFDFGKAELKPQAKATLDGVAARLREFPDARVVVEGHTDSVGKSDFNQTLSERRAAAVRDQLGLDPSRGVVRGYGASRPVASNDSDEGRRRNRRVDIVIIPARAKAH